MADSFEEEEEEEDEEEEVPEPVSEPLRVKRKIIGGKTYFMDKYYNLYDYELIVRDGIDVVVGLWDPVQDRVVERLIDV